MQRDGLVGQEDADANGAAVVYFGDGATSQGDVNEAFIFAASYAAPVVFFCQNNQYAISEPIALQSRIPLYRRASGFGFPGVRVDGNDVLAVHAVTHWAARTRSSRVRPGAHRGLHVPHGGTHHVRRPDEVPTQGGAGGVAGRRTRSRESSATCASTGAIDQAWLDAVTAEGDALGERLRAGCVDLPEPRLEDVWFHAYAEPPAFVERQRAEYLAYEASFEVTT